MKTRVCIALIIAAFFALAVACAKPGSNNVANSPATNSPTAAVQPGPTPAKNITAADIAKLKWLEGTWRGMDGDKPFYERYKFEDTAMSVEALKEDGSLEGQPDRFELKDGEFGRGEGTGRAAATKITADHVQFVPGPGAKGNNFRFVKTADGWDAILEWTTPDKGAQKKVYKMEKWTPKK